MSRRIAALFLMSLVLAAVLNGCGGGGTADQPVKQTLTIAWAQWAPADALKQLAEEWGAANNVQVKTVFVPWPDYPALVFKEFDSNGSTYDIIIGDSQWIGRGVVDKHYLELTQWMNAELKLKEFEPAALTAFCEYPRNSDRYYAAPCQLDATGFVYRKDLFEDPKEMAAFKTKYMRELLPPETWAQFRDVAEFFTRPEQKLYGTTLFTSKDYYDAVTMGFQQVMWSWGGMYCDENFKVEGVLNSDKSVKALEFYKDLVKFMPPDGANFYIAESLKALKEGSVAMSMNYFALMPELVDPNKNKFAKSLGFFAMPAGPDGRFASLGGQGMSINRHIPPARQDLAKNFIKWFCDTENQRRWVKNPGCFSANIVAMEDPVFLNAAPFNQAFSDSLPLLRDFYNIPEYGELLKLTQSRWHDVLTGKETAKEALDTLAKEHGEIIKKTLAR